MLIEIMDVEETASENAYSVKMSRKQSIRTTDTLGVQTK